MPDTAFPVRIREVARAACLALFRWAGWRVEGALPAAPKFVIIAAPHTSNWDFPLMLAVALSMRMPIRWMGKDAMFRWPFGPMMRALGGIAIDRSKANNIVTQTIAMFGAADALAIAIPPEGTRASVTRWKTGFYNIAVGAGVPIALGFLDYRRKIGGIAGTFYPTGDIDADMTVIRTFYEGIASHRSVHGGTRS